VYSAIAKTRLMCGADEWIGDAYDGLILQDIRKLANVQDDEVIGVGDGVKGDLILKRPAATAVTSRRQG